MPVPKKKHSKSRRSRRRSKDKVNAPKLVECPRCHEYKLPHRVCPNCGYYDGRQVKPSE